MQVNSSCGTYHTYITSPSTVGVVFAVGSRVVKFLKIDALILTLKFENFENYSQNLRWE